MLSFAVILRRAYLICLLLAVTLLVAYLIFLLVAVEVNEFNFNEFNMSLIFAQVIFRHGDRNPSRSYPNDPWKDEKYWPEGYGQLTKVGMQQEHELGQYIRKRYNNLLPTNIYPNKLIYVQSTDQDRALMSAESLLSGLFPPTNDQKWNKNIDWQPIPVHTIPRDMDYILAAEKRCDRFEYLLKQQFQRPEYMAWRLKYKTLYRYAAERSGLSSDSPTNIVYLWDTLMIQQLKNKTIPDWASEIFDELTKLSAFEGYTFIGTREMSRLYSGFLLREIADRFTLKIDDVLKPNRTLWIYSAHDETITGFLNLLGLFDFNYPPYAASLFLDLYQHNEDKKRYFVQISYKRSNDENVPPLEIPGCGTLCPLDKFYNIYKDFIPMNDFETECKME